MRTRTFSPTIYWGLLGAGAVILVVLHAIAWTSDTSEVGFTVGAKLQLSAAAFVLGGGLLYYARKYRSDAEEEAAQAEIVRRSLERRLRGVLQG